MKKNNNYVNFMLKDCYNGTIYGIIGLKDNDNIKEDIKKFQETIYEIKKENDNYDIESILSHDKLNAFDWLLCDVSTEYIEI